MVISEYFDGSNPKIVPRKPLFINLGPTWQSRIHTCGDLNYLAESESLHFRIHGLPISS